MAPAAACRCSFSRSGSRASARQCSSKREGWDELIVSPEGEAGYFREPPGGGSAILRDQAMRITLSGDLGSGKSTVGRRLAERLKLPHYSAGSLFREIGQISNLDALQTNLAAEDNVTIDEAVDNRTRELDRSGESFIIDSRMAWHFVTGAARVYLSASPETAARRIAADTT